ncbi:hypothetical protein LWI29_000964 [Acer saccharum]|uniref:Transmembrane protein n=1 Tax=Acer saccharum TaxID=4024 RepID=A0AA39TCC9_ACESA|nr:hypothetical protein LWI29_000964 [Acer saccharum]
MAPCNQRRSTVSAIETRITSNDLGSVAPAAKIAKKKKGVRSNGKLHVDFDSSIREPIGRTCFTFFTAIGTIVTRHAPRNVRKWDDIPEEKIQALIDRVLSMFDVDISIPYVKDWVLWRMKLRFRCIKQERATQKAQNAEIMKLMSKLAIGSSFDMDLEVDSTWVWGLIGISGVVALVGGVLVGLLRRPRSHSSRSAFVRMLGFVLFWLFYHLCVWVFSRFFSCFTAEDFDSWWRFTRQVARNFDRHRRSSGGSFPAAWVVLFQIIVVLLVGFCGFLCGLFVVIPSCGWDFFLPDVGLCSGLVLE